MKKVSVNVDAAQDFTFTRTLDRQLVNRRAVAEVFLTDFHPVSENEWVVGAQLPRGHAYYSDHYASPKYYDILLILECCRQAGTYDGYTQFGSSLDTINMVSSMQLRLFEPERLRVGQQPGGLVIHTRAVDIVRTAGRTKSATPEMTFFLDEAPLGAASIPVALATPKLFRALRSRMREGLPAPTSTMEPPAAQSARPSDVGRARPENVLITEPQRCEGEAHAALRLLPGNTNILDHDYDHIPAMALADAALQLLTWDTGRQRHTITEIKAHFDRFTEVDAPVILRGISDGDSSY